MRGLELKLTTLPKSSELMSLMGLSRFAWLRTLKKSAWNSRFLDSAREKRLDKEKSMLLWLGPRSTLRPTLPRSVPPSGANAVGSWAVGIACPGRTSAMVNAAGLKEQPGG